MSELQALSGDKVTVGQAYSHAEIGFSVSQSEARGATDGKRLSER